MKRLFQRLFGASAAPEMRAAPRAPLVAFHHTGRGMFSEKAGPALVRAGYHRNPVAYRCVRLVAESAANVPLSVTRKNRELAEEHPFETLLARPNPHQSGPELIEALVTHLLLAGNAYCHVLAGEAGPAEIYSLRPDCLRPIAGRNGWPEAYEYVIGGQVTRFPVEPDGASPILHLKLVDPLDDQNGFAPVAAAQMALDLHEAASRWNKALLDNSARPSGALVYGSGENLSEEQFERLKAELESAFQGSANAGRPVLLEGGLDWKPLSLSPKDMDFLEARSGAAREIALAFGVPPLLLGLPGDNTYANYAEANRAFYRSTVLPMTNRIARAMAQWLGPHYGEDFAVEPDPDRIEALSVEREALWRRVSAADFLTHDEKRAAIGYARNAAGDPPKPPAEPAAPS